MINGCPGASQSKNSPTIEVRTCPKCGKELEVFSHEGTTPCPGCGSAVSNEHVDPIIH